MRYESIIFMCLLIVVVLVIIMAVMLSGGDFCFEMHGIDHNGRNDPFTIFIGWCE